MSSQAIALESDLNKRLLALDRAVLALSADLSLSETLRRIVTAAAELVNAQYAALGVPDASGQTLTEFVTFGISEADEARIAQRPHGLGLLGLILHDGQALRLADLRAHAKSVGFPAHHPDMRSFLGVPIRHKDKLLGNLYLTNKRTAAEFTAEDQGLIELLAAHAGTAIENAHLYEQIQQLRVLQERERIGMDLHDGVIQSIYAVGLNLELVQALLAEGNTSHANQRITGAIEALNATMRDIRAYILGLRPLRFDKDDLVTSLQRLLTEFKANTLINVEFSASQPAAQAITPEQRLALCHIAQEALSNTARHGRASRVELYLSETAHVVNLTVRDNGLGFELAAAPRRPGHGLVNMRERAQALGGEVVVQSTVGAGTLVQASFPKHKK
jgi:signal transduction histidine kinase